MSDRRDPVEAGRWLKAERARLGASTTLVARLSTLIANRAVFTGGGVRFG